MTRRLPSQPGEWIDRERDLSFRFEGRDLTGYVGDTINSALSANGVRVIGRSFKYHRPRGVYSMAGHDANGLYTDGIRTNMRGDSTMIAEGMNLSAVNTFGNLDHDRMSITGHFAKCMPVGFYYKTFFRPRWMFPFHEKIIRGIAGLGTINPEGPDTHSPKEYAWCDVLVVGGGASGLAAARSAAEGGARVMLVDEQAKPGGSAAYDEISDLVKQVRAHDRIEIRGNTIASGIYTDHWVALVDEMKLTKLRAKSIVFATGAIEQPAVFQNNDLPGVMLASAARRLIRQYAVKPFDRVVMLTANRDGYDAALEFHRSGIDVAAVVDLRPDGEAGRSRDAVIEAGIEIRFNAAIVEARAGRGNKSITAAEACPIADDGTLELSLAEPLDCDGIAVSVGWMPNLALPCQAGVSFTYKGGLEQLMPERMPERISLAGSVNGHCDLEDCIQDGLRAGRQAAKAIGLFEGDVPDPLIPPEQASSHPYPIFEHPDGKNFVDFDEDLHLKDFQNAHAEGYDSIELIKRYSTVGMGPSQGKLANMNATRIVTALNGGRIDETGMTTARPFYQPVPIGHLAGRRFHPMRHTPMHDWHADQDAEFVHAGSWYRAEHYRKDGMNREDLILAEAKAVRKSAGLIDISTLGKLFVNGTDAVALLDRIYTGTFAQLGIGKQRYAVALDESGIVIEDGIVARIAEDVYYVTATSSGVETFYRDMQRWATVWEMDVTLVNATGQYAAMNLAGPQSREILSGLTNADLSPEAFPYLSGIRAEVAGVQALLLRVGFVGELGYEIHVPASHAIHVWRAIIDEGASRVSPFGLEAQRLLRLEKGHLIVGHDTDALTNLMEAGLSWTIGREKPFFIGKRSTKILAKQPQERILVGIGWGEGYSGRLPEECHLIVEGSTIVGRVTSIAAQSTLGYPLGMALVHPDWSKPGTELTARVDGELVKTKVVELPHYDSENSRQD